MGVCGVVCDRAFLRAGESLPSKEARWLEQERRLSPDEYLQTSGPSAAARIAHDRSEFFLNQPQLPIRDLGWALLAVKRGPSDSPLGRRPKEAQPAPIIVALGAAELVLGGPRRKKARRRGIP